MALEAKSLDEVMQESEGKDDGYMSINGFLRYGKQIRNLALQETQLHRRREKDLAPYSLCRTPVKRVATAHSTLPQSSL